MQCRMLHLVAGQEVHEVILPGLLQDGQIAAVYDFHTQRPPFPHKPPASSMAHDHQKQPQA